MSIDDAPNASQAFVAAFFEELVRSGVEHVCVCPGSRSTPLAVAAIRSQGLRAWSHVDERSAGFFALGLAKATRRPVALIATSGTAPANFLPAVIEAHYARVPLLVLSADRPPELRECGAGQTIDQLKLFGSHVRFFAELPAPDSGAEMLRYARSVACQAVSRASSVPAGPVHLNWPLREPLAPVPDPDQPATGWGEADPLATAGRMEEGGLAFTRVEHGVAEVSRQRIEALADLAVACPEGLISCGPEDESPGLAAVLTRLAGLTGWPIFADAASQLRTGSHSSEACVLSCGDLILRSESFAARHRPAVVLRFGNTPVSKAHRLWLEAAPPDHLVLVDPAGDWNEPSHLASELVVADSVRFCEALIDELETRFEVPRRSAWLERFEAAEVAASKTLEIAISQETRLMEPRAARVLSQTLPEDGLLYVSNSMPIRDLDAFMPCREESIRVLCNRGANGIDGMISSALGAAAGTKRPVALLTGDLAFLHDIGGLLAASRHDLSATIVVLDNDGGGIFSFLPVAAHSDAVGFEEYFTTPHGLDLANAARLFELDHVRVRSWQEYEEALEKKIHEDGVSIIEVPVDREANLEHFRAIVRAVDEALQT